MKRILGVYAVFGLLIFAPLASADTVRLQTEDYKDGGEGVGYSDTDVGNNGGGYRADDVDMEAAADDGDGFNVGWTQPGEWVILTTDTDPGPWTTDPTFAGGDYYVNYRVASSPGGGGFGVEIDGTRVDTIGPIGGTGGWQTWTTTSSSNAWHPMPVVSIGAGSHEVKLAWDGGDVNVNWIELTTDPFGVFFPELPLAFTPPQGSTGTWGVREVTNAGGVGNLSETVQRLNEDADGTNPGTRADYQAPVINIWDSGGEGHVEPSDPYGVVTNGDVAAGEVENIAMVMSGKIAVPTAGTYTFDVNSDDGFQLSIDGSIVMEFNAGKGVSDVLGKADLTAGTHDIRVLYWEGGGGAAVEVHAAQGDKDAYDDDFRLIGHKSIGSYGVPGIFVASVTVGSEPNGPDQIVNLAQAEAALAAGPNQEGEYTVVNFSDPEGGNDGDFPGGVPFPNDTPADDEDFGVMVTAALDIPEDGTYELGFNSDDGAKMRILGQDWSSILPGSHSGAVIDGEWLTTDELTGTSWTAGEIDLTAGFYKLEAIMFERGGGAGLEIFGRNSVGGAYELLTSTSARIAEDFDGLQLVPEPSTLAMLLGIAAIGLLVRRRK
jgi:hypothetical protein